MTVYNVEACSVRGFYWVYWELFVEDVGVTQSWFFANAERTVRDYLRFTGSPDADTAEIIIKKVAA